MHFLSVVSPYSSLAHVVKHLPDVLLNSKNLPDGQDKQFVSKWPLHVAQVVLQQKLGYAPFKKYPVAQVLH